MSHSDAEGLWQQAREVSAPGTEAKSLADVYTFNYERGLVTLRLLVISKVSWKSPDGFYTLRTRWAGNTLEYLAPLGQWAELAAYEDGRFVATGDGKRLEYERISPDRVVEYNVDILKADRPVFDYEQTR